MVAGSTKRCQYCVAPQDSRLLPARQACSSCKGSMPCGCLFTCLLFRGALQSSTQGRVWVEHMIQRSKQWPWCSKRTAKKGQGFQPFSSYSMMCSLPKLVDHLQLNDAGHEQAPCGIRGVLYGGVELVVDSGSELDVGPATCSKSPGFPCQKDNYSVAAVVQGLLDLLCPASWCHRRRCDRARWELARGRCQH